MDDPTYFGTKYKDYISNSKLGLLNPAQGGSPQIFFKGFSGNDSPALALGSAVHQLTLEPNDYTLSDLKGPTGKLAKAYNQFLDYRKRDFSLEKSMILACADTEYYVKEIVERSKDLPKGDIPSRLRSAIRSLIPYHLTKKPERDKDGKKFIYLPKDLHETCVSCTKSLKDNYDIQKTLNWINSYCEDVIIAEIGRAHV